MSNVRVEKRQIPCNVCDSKEFYDLYEDTLKGQAPTVDYNFNQDTRKTFKIVACKNCGLVFTNPMPKMGVFYTETEDEEYLKSESQRRYTARNSVKMITKYKKSGRLLDIGCSTGFFLDAAKDYFEVEGIELSKWAAEIASKKFKVFQKPLNKLNIKYKYDVITLWGVIEHFEDPKFELKEIYKHLAPGGILVIYTGNIDAWLPKLLRKKWWWFQGMHLYYFSKKTLSKLLTKIGFSILGSYNHTLYFQLFSLAISLKRYSVSRVLNPILSMPVIKNLMIPVKLSGEMVLLAKKGE